jgi:hypothetical protein
MVDRDVGLACIQSQDAADEPAAREARVERRCTIDQRNHRAYVFAEIAQRFETLMPRQRLVASPRKRSFASDFWSYWRTGSRQFV